MASVPEFIDILKVLSHHEVEFILVGGLAAVVQGAPVLTFDLDIVFLKDAENLPRLLAALQEIDARYVDPAGRHIVPDAEKLASFRMHQLVTSLGSLDAMEKIGAGMSYTDLVGNTQISEVAGVNVRVLDLETIILSKEQANREKDRATLHVLRRTLQMKQGNPADER